MLETLHIKNVALFEEAEISFGSNLNIISGETGAGKSMLMDAINVLLGERFGKDNIRLGEASAFVEGMFNVWDTQAVEAIKNIGIHIDEDNMLLISRTVTSEGKSTCRANGRAITVSMLKEISGYLIDIHGQNNTRSLLNPSRHMELLDVFCSVGLLSFKEQLAEKIKEYKAITERIKQISGDDKNREALIEMLTYQRDEIKEAALKPSEEAELTSRLQVLQNNGRLVKASAEAFSLLNGEGEAMSAVDQLSRAKVLVNELCELSLGDTSLSSLLETLQEAYAQAEEASRTLRQYIDTLSFEPDELSNIEARLDVIYNLKRKYGGSFLSIFHHYESVDNRLNELLSSDDELNELNAKKRQCTKQIVWLCEEMSALRKNAAEAIKSRLTDELNDLGMQNVRFDIIIERKKEFSVSGFDKVEFYISPNVGEPMRPLAKIASGGEMSRFMLALKTVLSRFSADSAMTFVFDEIDTGVSGKAAQKVAEKLAEISKTHQLVCITHLPQIAAMADVHFLIEKTADDERTTTNVYPLDEEESVMELTRLLGGAVITDSTVVAARELKEMAQSFKTNMQ